MEFRDDGDASGELFELLPVIERNDQPWRRRGDLHGMLHLHQVTSDRRIDLVDQPGNEVRKADAVENAFARLEDSNPHRNLII